MPQKQVESIQSKVESIVTAMAAQVSIPLDVAKWLGLIGDDIYAKLERLGLVEAREIGAKKSHTQLKSFLDSYIASRDDAKKSTLTFYGHTRRCLIEFFGAKKKLAAITIADAEKFRRMRN